MAIKTEPQYENKDALNKVAADAEKAFKDAFDTRKFDHKFDDAYANALCLDLYGQAVRDAYEKS